jgi:hypothetical protein
MRYRIGLVIQAVLLLITGIAPGRAAAAGQGAATIPLDEQLSAQYTLVKLGTDSGGTSVLEPGTVLEIEKAGVLSLPPAANTFCSSKHQDGSIHAPNRFCTTLLKTKSSYFEVGQKVYPSKLTVDLKKERVLFGVVACDSCNGTNPPTFYKAEVIFQFRKGYLQHASASEIEDTLGEVFAIDNGNGNGDQSQGGQAQAGQSSQSSQAQPATSAAPSDPQSIRLGETPDQVKATLGPPEKIADLGTKKIYVYKDMKITFVHDKVSDVE